MKKPLILVIDDDAANRAYVIAALEREGYQVESASNGEEGWFALLRVRPALILLDLHMPLMTGWNFAQKIEQEGIPVPIIVMTGGLDSVKDAVELGAVDLLKKPFRLEELSTKVAAHLRRR